MSSSMRIGIVTYDYDPPIGGQGVYVKSLTQYLTRQNIDHVVIHPPKLPLFTLPKLGPLLYSVIANLRLNQWVKQYQLSLLHIQTGAGGVLLATKPSIPTLTTSHLLYSSKYAIHPNLFYLLLKKIEKRTFHQSQTVIATSRTMAKELADQYHLHPDRIQTIYYGIDTTAFSPKAGKQKTDAVLYVGRIEPRKRVLELVSVIEHLKPQFPELTLTIIGTGTQAPILKQYLASHRLESYITYQGYIAHEDLPRFYKEASLVVVPSSREAFGINVVESLLCGTPVIVAHNSGIGDVIAKAGCFATFTDSLPDLSKKISQFLAQPQTLSQESRRLGVTYFDQNRMVQKTKQLYENLAS